MNSDAEMLQAMEHLADQIDRLAAMLEECVALTRAGVPISAPSIDRYAAELERLTRERAALKRRFDVAHQKGLRALKRGDYHQFGKIIADERAIIDELARQKPTARKRKATKKR